MHNILLIAKREFLERIRSKTFRITTILVPLGILLTVAGGNLLAKKAGGLNHLAIVSNNAPLANSLKSQLTASSHPPKSIDVISPAAPDTRDQLTAQLDSGKIDGFLWITLPAGQTRPTATFYTRNSSDLFTQARLESSLGRASLRQALIARGISAADARALVKPIDITTLQIKAGHAVKTNVERSYLGTYGLVFLLYFIVLFYGTDAARSVTEEKSSRIFEVLLSSAPSDSLLMGKLLGVGASALLQVAIWIGIALAFAGSSLATQIGMHGLASLGINTTELIFFTVFFLLGFFFYSSLSTALGSTVNSPQEVQQFSFFIISPLIISVFMMSYVMSNPNSLASTILSFIPPFTPIIMYLRIGSQMPPMWQILLSIAILLASIWGMIWIAARIYRIGILMYGKRPTLPEIIRWLRYT